MLLPDSHIKYIRYALTTQKISVNYIFAKVVLLNGRKTKQNSNALQRLPGTMRNVDIEQPYCVNILACRLYRCQFCFEAYLSVVRVFTCWG